MVLVVVLGGTSLMSTTSLFTADLPAHRYLFTQYTNFGLLSFRHMSLDEVPPSVKQILTRKKRTVPPASDKKNYEKETKRETRESVCRLENDVEDCRNIVQLFCYHNSSRLSGYTEESAKVDFSINPSALPHTLQG